MKIASILIGRYEDFENSIDFAWEVSTVWKTLKNNIDFDREGCTF